MLNVLTWPFVAGCAFGGFVGPLVARPAAAVARSLCCRRRREVPPPADPLPEDAAAALAALASGLEAIGSHWHYPPAARATALRTSYQGMARPAERAGLARLLVTASVHDPDALRGWLQEEAIPVLLGRANAKVLDHLAGHTCIGSITPAHLRRGIADLWGAGVRPDEPLTLLMGPAAFAMLAEDARWGAVGTWLGDLTGSERAYGTLARVYGVSLMCDRDMPAGAHVLYGPGAVSLQGVLPEGPVAEGLTPIASVTRGVIGIPFRVAVSRDDEGALVASCETQYVLIHRPELCCSL